MRLTSVFQVSAAFYTKNDKKYIDLVLDTDTLERVKRIHIESSYPACTLVDPLVENVLTVKIPWKYNRIACPVQGNRTLYDVVAGDSIQATLEFCGVWETHGYCGPSWKCTRILV
jgi:hypothetical protein